MTTTHDELKHEIQHARREIKKQIEDLHDDLRDNHFAVVLEAIARIQAGGTQGIREAIMALTESVDTLGTLVSKVVEDGKTSAAAIQAGLDEIARLIGQGSADKAELEALKATVDAAVPSIDAANERLRVLDESVADPAQPDLDPNTPVG